MNEQITAANLVKRSAGPLVFALFLAFAAPISPVAAEEINESPIAEDIRIVRGTQLEICREYSRSLREHNATYNYCGVALPSGNSDFQLPNWEDIDPAAHMDLVREIFYWTNAKFNYLWDNASFLKRQMNVREIVPEMFDAMWNPARADVERLVVGGSVTLQRSQLDLNFDGDSEPVYRMTPLLLKASGRVSDVPTYPGIAVLDRQCTSLGLPGGDRDFVYYVRAADSHGPHQFLRGTGLWRGMNLFSYRERVHWLLDMTVHEAQPAQTVAEGSFGLAIVCQYDIRPSE
ncbi:MAG: hypothetical protein OEN55_12745 [Alphaproteobacteria bacterium]|nr:hypothetical protein [Alphaproteobacteria bacterium]